METPGLVGTGSVLDSEAWQEVMQHRLPAPRSRPPSILETGATCKPPSFPCTPYLHVATTPCVEDTHPLNQLAHMLVCDLCCIDRHLDRVTLCCKCFANKQLTLVGVQVCTMRLRYMLTKPCAPVIKDQ